MLIELKPSNAADKSAIAGFVRLLQSETLKLNFERVVTLIRYVAMQCRSMMKRAG